MSNSSKSGAGKAAGSTTSKSGAGKVAGSTTSKSGAGKAAGSTTSKSGAGKAAGSTTSKSGAGKVAGSTTSKSGAGKAADSTASKSGTGKAARVYSLKAGTPIMVKTADVVAATGKTTAWIRDLTARGVIRETDTEHGRLYDLIETVRQYCAMLEARKGDAADIDLQRKIAEAKLKQAKADIAEMQAKELAGKMHRSEDVQKMTADLLYYVRGGLMALAGRCAVDCAAASTPAEVQKIIEREVWEILRDLSEYQYDPKKYDELVRQRTRRELDAVGDDDNDDE